MTTNSLKTSQTPPKQEEGNPFAKTNRIIRSPVLKSNLQPRSELEKTQNKNETSASQMIEKVSIDTTIEERLNMFEKRCEALQNQVNELLIENQKLKESLSKNAKDIDLPMEIETPAASEFHTDEEELARETEWIVHKNKKKNPKKRKLNSSPEGDISNKPSKRKAIVKKPKLPPVILSEISDFNKVKDALSKQNINYEMKLLNNEQLSFKVDSENDYRILTKAVDEAKFEWHSYQNKADRPSKVMARGLHPTCNPKDILDDLKESGLKITSVVNIIKKRKENDTQIVDRLPLFMLTFDHSEDIKKIFSITHIVNTKVKIEAVKKRNDQIPQCKRCQRFEHTQSYCRRDPRCVKCAGSHLTIDCRIDAKAPPKCSNCHEAHPANYRGCVVAKELQKRRLANKKVEVTKPQQQKLLTPRPVNGALYSDVARKAPSGSVLNQSQVRRHDTPKGNTKIQQNKLPVKKPIISNRSKTPNRNDSNHMMERLISKIDEISARLEKIENRYASKHIGTPRSILKQ